MPRIRPSLQTGSQCNGSCGDGVTGSATVKDKRTKCSGTDETPCIKHPVFNVPGKLVGIFCAEHKADGMIDVKARRCTGKNADGSLCKKQPVYNAPDESRGIFCKEHKADGMVDVKSSRCTGTNADGSSCTTQPAFNMPGKSVGIFCKEHKADGMVDVKHSRCTGTNADGSSCTTRPMYNNAGKSRGIFCKEHKVDGMVDVITPRCITPHCDTRAIKAYKGHCYRCFINTYPDNKIVRNHKTKERAVADFVRATYPDYTIAFDQRVADGRSRRRPDIFVDMGDYVVVVETDENAHQAYDCSCENKRLMELFVDAGSRPLVMVRFNPDQYYTRLEKSIPSCWGYTKDKGLCVVKPNKTVEWTTRLATLKTTLDMVFSQGPSKEVDVIHLYYDGF